MTAAQLTIPFAPLAPDVAPGVASIPLRRLDGTIVAWTVVDEADAAMLEAFTWRLSGDGYAARSETREGRFRDVFVHRVVLGLEYGNPRQGDHRNGQRLDNRRANLAIVAGHRENNQNVGSRVGSSPHRGVHWDKRKRQWHAQVRLDGRAVHCGYYYDEVHAATAAAMFRRAHMPYSIEGRGRWPENLERPEEIPPPCSLYLDPSRIDAIA